MKWSDCNDRLGNANQLTVIFRLNSPNDIRIQEHHPGSVRGRAGPERPEYPGVPICSLMPADLVIQRHLCSLRIHQKLGFLEK